jgi:methionyl-tRNA synthetase
VEYIQTHPEFIQPDFRRNETLGFLRKPLQDLCISRPKTRLAWGIELPFDKDYVTYVWFDALVNYISAIGYRRDDAQFARWWPAIHLIGKDILTTHTGILAVHAQGHGRGDAADDFCARLVALWARPR